MRSPLTVAVAQPRCHPHDVEANVAAHVDIVEQAAARLVVFPELSLTGYHFDAELIAAHDPRLAPLIEACGAHGATALVGAPVLSSRGRHIGVLAVTGQGAEAVYHKMFLGASEEEHFTAGARPAVIEVDGWRIGLAVCKDTGVAAHAAATAALGMDVLAAGVLESIEDAEVQPERARGVARRHNVWVATASFAGSTGEGYTVAAGGSAIRRPDGILVAAAGTEVGGWAMAAVADGR